ncbi:MAG TPA: glycosyltransferase family 4 protein [Desulfitobacteriaceae bacterium]|nr:glycosyltransferase family 4 protein [Desulfitobacteriaceae bacterium]
MRVLVLAGWYPNSRNTVKGVFVQEQVLALQEAGIEIMVFYPFDEEVAPGKTVTEMKGGFPVYRINSNYGRNPYVARICSYWRTLRTLQQIVTRHQPDIIHVHVGYPAAIIAWLYAWYSPIPYIITEHMSYLQDYIAKWQHRVLLKAAFERAALILPVSRSLQEQIRNFGWDTALRVVPNVVDIDLFQLSAQRLPTADLKILFVGGMEETQVKGLNYLLPAFAQVVSKIPQKVELQLIGDGPWRQHYQNMAEKLGISPYCTFYGQIEHQAMPAYYSQSDFLVLSSLKETFGCVLVEAMASGKPVLATACGGPEDIVTGEVGLLVKPGDVEALTQGILRMIASLPGYRAEEIREYARKKYSRAVIAQTMREIYQGLQGST